MDLDQLTTRASEALSGGSDFKKTVKFDFGSVGKLLINGAEGKVDNSDGPADATISVTWDDFTKIASGAMDPTMAFMQGKLKVAGDMSVAMQLQSLMKKLAG
ncbi:MAG: SCP2 sterol-binding domain-containing protein [Hyphomonas sp.]